MGMFVYWFRLVFLISTKHHVPGFISRCTCPGIKRNLKWSPTRDGAVHLICRKGSMQISKSTKKSRYWLNASGLVILIFRWKMSFFKILNCIHTMNTLFFGAPCYKRVSLCDIIIIPVLFVFIIRLFKSLILILGESHIWLVSIQLC